MLTLILTLILTLTLTLTLTLILSLTGADEEDSHVIMVVLNGNHQAVSLQAVGQRRVRTVVQQLLHPTCMYVYVCIFYTYIHTYIHIYIHTYIHI